MPRVDPKTGLMRTQAVETHRSNGGTYAPPVAAATEDGGQWDGWERWMQGHLDIRTDQIVQGIARGMATHRIELESKLKQQQKQIHELELKCAQLAGALDVLRKGVPGGALNPRGTHDSLTAYSALDVVMRGGSSWVAVKDFPGELPGPGWRLLASAGARGQRGPPGRQGERGDAAPVWRGVSFDPRKRSFVTKLSDGTEGPRIPLDFICTGVDLDPATYSVVFRLFDNSEMKFSLRPLFQNFFDEIDAELQRARRP